MGYDETTTKYTVAKLLQEKTETAKIAITGVLLLIIL
jgi:hypothetical protein